MSQISGEGSSLDAGGSKKGSVSSMSSATGKSMSRMRKGKSRARSRVRSRIGLSKMGGKKGRRAKRDPFKRVRRRRTGGRRARK